MSIALHLIQNVLMRPFHSERNPTRSMAMQLKRHTGDAKLNHTIFGNILSFSRKKLQLWRLHNGLILHARYRSDLEFVVKAEAEAEAAGYPISDESFRRDGEKKMMKSSINSSDAGKNRKEFQFRFTGEQGTEDGHGHGHGHGGSGSGGDDTNNSGGWYGGLGGSDGGLLDTVWWWLWQLQRVLRMSGGTWGSGCNELLMSMEMVRLITPSFVAATQLLSVAFPNQLIPLLLVLPVLPFYLFLHIFAGFMEAMLISAAFLALAAVVSVGVISWYLLCTWDNSDDHDSDY